MEQHSQKYTRKRRIGAMRKHVPSVTTTSLELEMHTFHILVDVSLLFPEANSTFVKSILVDKEIYILYNLF